MGEVDGGLWQVGKATYGVLAGREAEEGERSVEDRLLEVTMRD